MISVCKDCPDRKVGCHGTCKKYLDEKKTHDEKRQIGLETKHQYKQMDDIFFRTHDRIQKRKRR